MAEIYRDSTPALTLGVAAATNVSADITRDGTTVATPTMTGETFTLPYSVAAYDGPFTIKWTFTADGTTLSRTESHEIVTPYVLVADARSELEIPADITDTKIMLTERRVRKIIDRFCGQSFGKYQASKVVLGKGDLMLALPEPLVELDSISGPYLVTDITQYDLRGNGLYLARSANYPEGDWVFNNVIAAPDWGPSVYTVGPDWYSDATWQDDVRYTITGAWGWDDVPTAVREASLILIEQALCPDSEFRNRYVDDTQYGDSSIGFDPRAFTGTGNVQADQLLSDYIRTTFTVI